MKTKAHVGNVTLIVRKSEGQSKSYLWLGKKRPKKRSDDKRKRIKVGSGCWVPAGGGTEKTDKSQKHSAQREVLEETGMFIPLKKFQKVGILTGYLDNDPIWIVHLYFVLTRSNDNVVVSKGEYVDARWFPITKLPFDRMMKGDKLWIPRILKGEKLKVGIFFEVSVGNFVKSKIERIKSFN